MTGGRDGRSVTPTAETSTLASGDGVQFAPLECIQEIAREHRPLSGRRARPSLVRMLGPPHERLPHLRAEPGVRQSFRLARGQIAVQPGRPGGGHLRLERQIGPDHSTQPLPAIATRERPRFDDRTHLRVAGRFRAGEPDVVRASAQAVDDDISRAVQLVMQPAIGEPTRPIRLAVAVDRERPKVGGRDRCDLAPGAWS